MSAPTLYRLLFKRNPHGDYDVYEQHRCQQKGCFWTDEQYITTCLIGKVDEFITEYETNLIEGEVDEVVVE